MPLNSEINGSTSDGYHTFDELYEHRIVLYLALCRQLVDQGVKQLRPWRSLLHSDGTSFDGWFILGIGKEPGEQITYHLPMSRWGETFFAETLPKAPEFDGHTPKDVLERIGRL
jgi:hypothetical protein